MNADLAQLLRSGLCDVDAILLAGHDADRERDLRAAALIVAVCAHHAARVLQKLLRLFGVIVIVLNIFVVVDVPLKRSIGGHALPEQNGVHNRLPVNGVADRGDEITVLGPVVVPEVEENAAIVARLHVVAGEAVLACKLRGVLRVEQREVEFTGLQLQRLRIVVRDDLEHDAVNLRRALVIVLVFRQDDGLSNVPAFELVWPGADRGAEEVRLLPVLAREQMLRQDGHRHVIEERNVRRGEAEGDRVLVRDGDLFDIFEVRRVFRTVFRIHDRLNREFHVVRRDRLAVVPREVFAEVERVGVRRLVQLPRLGKTGHDVILAVVCRQAVEEEQVDLTVLVHRRVDARIVRGAVGQRRRLRAVRGCALRRVGRGGVGGFCTGCQREQHGERQKRCQKLFHVSSQKSGFGPVLPDFCLSTSVF